jgi:type II secretory pathway pseudopilin PulG
MLRLLRNKRTVGFTVIEILAVAAIVSGGYAKYGGALAKAKNKAVEIECTSNLRQIGQAIQMYELTEGRLPDAKFYPKEPRKDPKSLVRILGPQFAKFLVCPSMPETLRKRGLTFLWNEKYSGKPLGSIPNPSKTWLMIEMSAVYPEAPPPHRGGFLVLYADMHVRWTKELPKDLIVKKKSAEQAGEPQQNRDPDGPAER